MLADSDTDTRFLDASLLLSHVIHVERAKLLMELHTTISNEVFEAFSQLVKRRAAGEPVAWITGKKEFWGRNFMVGSGGLCPRPDTETLVEAALACMDGFTVPGSLHDCCTGPGTVALSLSADRPDWTISASDVSEQAEKYFHANNRSIAGNRVTFTRSDMMERIDGPFDIIVSNPPYLSPSEVSERLASGWKEPELALNGGGSDGLDFIRRMVPRAATRLETGGFLMIEAHPRQLPIMEQILLKSNFQNLEIKKDLAKRDRVLIGRYCGGV